MNQVKNFYLQEKREREREREKKKREKKKRARKSKNEQDFKYLLTIILTGGHK